MVSGGIMQGLGKRFHVKLADDIITIIGWMAWLADKLATTHIPLITAHKVELVVDPVIKRRSVHCCMLFVLISWTQQANSPSNWNESKHSPEEEEMIALNTHALWWGLTQKLCFRQHSSMAYSLAHRSCGIGWTIIAGHAPHRSPTDPALLRPWPLHDMYHFFYTGQIC